MTTTTVNILHGENQLASRAVFQQQIEAAKENGKEIERFEAKTLSLADLETALSSQSLFNTPRLLVIEELHSLPKSKRKIELISLLGEAKTVDLLLWEKRSLTKAMLSKFSRAKTQEFKLSKNLFKWLESWGLPAREVLLLQKAVFEQDGPQLALAMLARQARLLLETKSGFAPAAPAFVLSRLKTQCQHFTLQDLIKLHQELLDIDLREKTSNNRLTLIQALDLLACKY